MHLLYAVSMMLFCKQTKEFHNVLEQQPTNLQCRENVLKIKIKNQNYINCNWNLYLKTQSKRVSICFVKFFTTCFCSRIKYLKIYEIYFFALKSLPRKSLTLKKALNCMQIYFPNEQKKTTTTTSSSTFFFSFVICIIFYW